MKKGFTLAEGATRVNMMPTKSNGFTLAEILITLGIIGIVAAITIPTLVTNVRASQYRSQFKKTLSTLNQAVRMNKAQYDWDFSNFYYRNLNEGHCAYVGIAGNPENDKTMCAIINWALSGAQPILGDNNYYPATDGEGNYLIKLYSDSTLNGNVLGDLDAYTLADGSVFAYLNGPGNCFLPVGETFEQAYEFKDMNSPMLMACMGFIDVNGPKLPNKEVKCSNGETKIEPSKPCIVKNKDIGDVFPVVFYDTTVAPATNASAYVLNSGK